MNIYGFQFPVLLPKVVLFFLGCARKFHEIGFDKPIQIAVHHCANIAGLVIGTVVFYAAGVRHVTAYLRSPLNFLFGSLHLGDLCTAFFQCEFVELRFKESHGVLAVAQLRTALGVFDQDLARFAGVRIAVVVA